MVLLIYYFLYISSKVFLSLFFQSNQPLQETTPFAKQPAKDGEETFKLLFSI